MMNYKIYFERLQYITELIENGRLSTPGQLSGAFGCCEKTVRRMINDLRNDGVNIKYSRKLEKYFIEKT